MVGARGARRWIAPRVQKVILVCAYHMVVAGVVCFLNVQRVHRVVQISARLMVGAKGVHTWVASKGLKGAHPSARRMVVENAVHFKVARSVCMVALNSVLPMVVGKGALPQIALEVPGERPITVFGMVAERDARLRAVERVLREALISARHMEEESVVIGASLGQVLVLGARNVIF